MKRKVVGVGVGTMKEEVEMITKTEETAETMDLENPESTDHVMSRMTGWGTETTGGGVDPAREEEM